MILPDVNILIYAYNRGDVRYLAAGKWFEALMNGTQCVLLLGNNKWIH